MGEKQNWILLLEAAISRLTDGDNENDDELSVMRDEHYAPYWIPDESSNKCSCCNVEFSVLNRKHHCRRCGNLVCKLCSKNRALLANIDKNKAVRVCNDCHKLIHSL